MEAKLVIVGLSFGLATAIFAVSSLEWLRPVTSGLVALGSMTALSFIRGAIRELR